MCIIHTVKLFLANYCKLGIKFSLIVAKFNCTIGNMQACNLTLIEYTLRDSLAPWRIRKDSDINVATNSFLKQQFSSYPHFHDLPHRSSKTGQDPMSLHVYGRRCLFVSNTHSIHKSVSVLLVTIDQEAFKIARPPLFPKRDYLFFSKFLRMFVVAFQTAQPLLNIIGRVVPIIVHPNLVDECLAMDCLKSVWLEVVDLTHVIPMLDKGVDKVIISYELIVNMSLQQLDGLFGEIQKTRLVLRGKINSTTNGYFSASINSDIQSIKDYGIVRAEHMEDLESRLTVGSGAIVDSTLFSNHSSPIDYFTTLLLKNVKSDRVDGLFPTVVVDQQKVCLGLCYSSAASLSESFRLQSGVYFSRTRGLWYKGKTSGATQKLLRVDLDCDNDTFCFTVDQKDPGIFIGFTKGSAI